MGADVCPKLVVFLGAGASAAAGYRTFETFPDLVFNAGIGVAGGLPDLHTSTPALLREVEQSLRIAGQATTHDNFLWALNDYTRLWDMLRTNGVLRSRFLNNTTKWGEFAYFSRITEDASTDVTRTTIQHYSTNRVEAARPRGGAPYHRLHDIFNLYRTLAIQNDDGSPYLPVFTTNYDMLIEDLFAEFGSSSSPSGAFPLVNGIPDCTAEGSPWDGSQYQQHESPALGLHLYRLHGCVCWFYHGLGDERVFFHRRDCLECPPRDLCAMYPGRERFRGVNPHALGSNRWYEMLAGCQCLIFIGFSFRDDDVLHLLLSANAERSEPLKIIAVDPRLKNTDVHELFENASKRTPFPVRIPDANDIKCIDARSGAPDFDKLVMNAISSV